MMYFGAENRIQRIVKELHTELSLFAYFLGFILMHFLTLNLISSYLIGLNVINYI